MTSTEKTMKELAQEYLAFRRSLGFQLRVEGQQLLKFAEFVDRSDHSGPLTTELALRWACLPTGASPLYRARRLEVVRGFARFRAIFDDGTEIPAQRLLGEAHRRTAPHVYSDGEISDLLHAASRLSPHGGIRPRTFQTLFGLLASTGLRISEALRLRLKDVDSNQQLLVIKETKFQKTRLVPLHPSVAAKLDSYIGFRDQCVPLSESDTLFVSARGTALNYSTVRNTFRTLCKRLGWKPEDGRRRPRMYDLRHTFACRRLLQWYRDGIEIDHAISSLSTYMGHVKVTDTYWYLTGTPELFRVAAERFEQHFQTAGKETRS
jgi:integrase